ncbi:PAS domain-containing sensor histidine kinase [Mucilaginibacter agri]|uniref:histidine kinase n=1 Tax=Mucilaginibacter agri TaxID=2695265 RepID=A0A966DRY5_9SPHI|nr:ATP-binding protein [Mucilaginibacter agri]NCD67766.1 hypothetical protein [Mucilaginibacter agri]
MNQEQLSSSEPKSVAEQARLRALTRYRIAGTQPEEAFDHYVQMATLIFRIPAAIIAFVGENTIHPKASIGIGSTENNAVYALPFAATIQAKNDIHISYNGEAGFTPAANTTYTYYAGTAICTSDGHAIGCLSLLDHKERELTPEQISVLKILASGVMDKIEERLRSLQERERSHWLSKTTQEGMWEWDINHNRMWWNTGFCLLFGYPPPNTSQYDLDFWCLRFVNESCESVKKSMLSLFFDGEYIFKKGDDTEAYVLIRSVLVRDEFGQPIKIMGSMLDISERFRNEERSRRANIELLRHKDDFISIASHEIKTPITIIKSYSQIIRKEAERNIDQNPNLSLYANRILKQSEKLLKLVENLLDVSRINNGKMVIYPASFNFSALLEQTIDELLDMDSGSHQIEVKGDFPLTVYADEFRISQVLTNLITNAIKYSPDADKVVVTCYKNAEENLATIAVQDFGLGIAKADQVELFEKFHRLTDLRDNRIPGTGLGLSIAMEIMKQHGSTITLESELGKGSIFSFDLMLSPAFNTQL